MSKDKAINSIKSSCRNLSDLGPLWLIFCHHRLHQLRLDEDWLGCAICSLDAPFLGKHQLLRRQLPLYFISDKDSSVTLRKNIFELLDSLQSINLGENLDVLSLWAEEFSNGHWIGTRIAEWDCEVVDHNQLGNRCDVFDILLGHQLQIAVLSAGESHIAVALDGSSDFDLHLDLLGGHLDNDSYNFSIVKIDNVIGFQKSLDNVAANSELCVARFHVVLIDHHADCRSTSDSLSCCLETGNSDFSAPGLKHEGASLVRS